MGVLLIAWQEIVLEKISDSLTIKKKRSLQVPCHCFIKTLFKEVRDLKIVLIITEAVPLERA